MRINKQQLERLMELPDDALWREIVAIGGAHGFKLPEKTPTHDELMKLRSIANGKKINLSDAMKLLNEYRRGGGV